MKTMLSTWSKKIRLFFLSTQIVIGGMIAVSLVAGILIPDLKESFSGKEQPVNSSQHNINNESSANLVFSSKLIIDAEDLAFPLSVCGNSDVINVNIIHNGIVTDTFKNVKTALTAPVGIDFSEITILKGGPAMILGDTIMWTGDSLNSPGDTLRFTVRVKATCNVDPNLASGNFNVTVKHKPIGSDSICTDATPILINRADLSMPSVAPISIFAVLGNKEVVMVTVANAGNGPLDSFKYCVTNNNPDAVIDSIVVNGMKLTVTSPSPAGFICFKMPTIGVNQNLFVKEYWSIIGCISPAPQLQRRVQYGCEGINDCQNKSQGVFPGTDLIYGIAVPVLTPSLKGNTRPACYTTTATLDTMKITNTGTAPAKNIVVTFNTGGQFTGTYTITYPGGSVPEQVKEIAVNTSNCNGVSVLSSFTDTIKNINLKPGEFIEIAYSTIYSCDCNNCSISGAYQSSMTVNSYTDLCNISYTSGASANTISYNAGIATFVEGPVNITGNEMGVIEYPFTSFGISWNDPVFYPNAFFENIISLECGLDPVPGSYKITDQLGNVWTPSMVTYTDAGLGGSDTLKLRFKFSDIPVGFQLRRQAVLSIKVMGDCTEKPTPPDCANPVFPVVIKHHTDLVIDPTCPDACVRQKIGLSPDLKVDLVCPQPGCPTCNGFACTSLDVERTNFGLPDADNNQEVNGTLNTALVQKDRFLQGDTLKATFKGYVREIIDAGNWNFGYAILKLPFGNYTPLNAQVVIKDADGGTYTCNAVSITSNMADSTLRVDISAASMNGFGCSIPAGFDFDDNDSVIVCLNFVTKDPFVGLQRPVEFYSSIFVSDAPFGGPMYTCGGSQCRDRITQVGISYSTAKTFNSFGACDLSSGWSFSETRYYGDQDFDEFPYEIRPLGMPKTISFTKPSAFEYRLDQFGTSLYQRLSPDRLVHSISSNIPSIFLVQSGDQVTFFAQDYYNTIVTPLLPLDEGYEFNFYPKIYGNCRSVPGSYNISLQMTSAVDENVFCTPMIMSPQVTCPFTYSGGAQLVVLPDVTDVRLCSAEEMVVIRVHNVSSSNAPNAFIYAYSATGAVTIARIEDFATNTVLTGNQFGIYPIPNVSAGATRKYKVYVTANSCRPESISFIAGWDCVKTPTTVQEATCSDPSIINFTVAQAGLNIDVIQPPTDINVDLCDTIPYELQVRSTDLGFLRDIILNASIPSGQSVVPGSYEIAVPGVLQGGTYKPVTGVTILPGGFSIKVSQQDTVLKNIGLVGSKDLTKNTVDIRFKTVTACGYRSGSRLIFTAKANNTCGDPLVPVIKPSRRLRMKNVKPKFTVAIQSTKAVMNPCSEDMIVSKVKMQLTSSAPAIGDSIIYTLAPGIEYKPGTYTPIVNAIATPPTVRYENGIQVLVWPFLNPIASGSIVEFSVGLMATDAGLECSDLELKIEAFASTNAMCGLITCSIGVLAGEGSLIIHIVKPKLEFVIFDASIMVDPGNPAQTIVNTNIKLVNNGSYMEAGDTVFLDLYEDVDNNGYRSAPDILIKTLFQVLTLNLNLGDCVYFNEQFTVPSGTICRLIGVINPAKTCSCSETPSNQLQLDLIQSFTKDTFTCSNSPLTFGPQPITNYGYEWLSLNGSPLTALSNTTGTPTTFTWPNNSGATVTYKYGLRSSLRGCYTFDTVCIKLSPELSDSFNVQACQNQPFNLPVPATATSNLVWSPAGLIFPNGAGTLPAVLPIVPLSDATYTLTYLDANGCPGIAKVVISPVDCGTGIAGLGDTVWFDFDKDGLQEVGEPGIGGVTVNLYNGLNGSLVSTTVTDPTGFYQFINLPPGTYFVQFVPLAGFIPTSPNAMGNTKDTLDSDAGINGITGNYLIPINTYNPTVDAGFIPDCSLELNLTVSDCIKQGNMMVRKITANINWDGNPYTYDQFFGHDTMYVNLGDTLIKLRIDTLGGDTTLCRFVKLGVTTDIIANASFFHIPDCAAADTVKAVTPCVYDLALKKTIANPGPYKYNDTICFRIVVFNQGTQPVTSVVVNDYLLAGYEFIGPANPSWAFDGGGNLQHLITGPLAAGASDTFTLKVLLKPTSDPNEWLNYAEIAKFRDINNVDISDQDIDSRPDNNANNDGGGLVNSSADDYIFGDGTSTTRDGIPGTDEDDSDPALPVVFDLAIIKQIDTAGTVASGSNLNALTNGDTVKFKMIIENQGNIKAQNIQITDYIPNGFDFINSGALNPGWSGVPPNVSYTITDKLAPWKRDTICIYLKIKSVPAAMITQESWVNRSEISMAQDTTGADQSANDADFVLNNNPADNVGGEFKSLADDEFYGDGTATMRDNVGFTDQDNEDPAGVKIVDLALTKMVAPGSVATSYGDTVKFNVRIYNQGNTYIDSVTVIDSFPVGLTFDPSLSINAEWVSMGSEAKRTIRGRLAPGQDTIICIGAKVNRIINPALMPTGYINTAEISNAYDTLGMAVTDVDSPLDDNYGNSGGGGSGTSADNEIYGDGTGAPGDGVGSSDQDNADPALVPIADLALRKVIADTLGDATLNYGDTIKFAIQIFNQGSTPVGSIVIKDSIPAGYEFVLGALNAGWSLMASEATFLWGAADTLLSGESDTICIYLKLKMVAPSSPSAWINRAEISYFSDINGNELVDIDSKPDNNHTNDSGGNLGTPSDDAVDGDGMGVPGSIDANTDEDDEDPAGVKIVDLALTKKVAPGSVVTAYGDTVKYLITVYNQGNVPMDSIAITDSLPSGLMFDPILPINSTWTATGSEIKTTIRGVLLPGEDTTICVALKVLRVTDLTMLPEAYINLAEISAAFDTAGTNVSNQDIDSPLDDNYGNNGGGNPNSPADDATNGNGTAAPGGSIDSTDQDNADPALVAVADLALRKTIVDTLGDNILLFGDTVKLAITIFNQGSIPVDSVVITDSLPAGLGFVTGPLNLGWTYAAPEAMYSINTRLNPGDSVVVYIYAKFQLAIPATPKTFTNIAEITFFSDTDNIELIDVDSKPDDNQANDAGGEAKTNSDNAIDGDGTGMPGDTSAVTDEDDMDIVEIGYFDLALNKVIAPGSTATAYGDTVKYLITVTNQGSIPTDSFTITDSLPAGLMFVPANAANAGWVLSGNKVRRTLSGFLLMGMEDTTICIVLKPVPILDPAIRAGAWTNYAEISSAFLAGNDLSEQDIDSKLDDNLSNNAGGQPESPADNTVDGNGMGAIGDGVAATDQDNADPALLKIPDLALRKTIADTLGDNVLKYRDTIKFAIQIFNQGNVPIDSLTIVDTLPSGLTYVNGPLNAGWTYAPNEAIYQYGGNTLNPGDSFKVCIYAILTKITTGIPNYTNQAEISYAEDTSGTSIVDIDSPLDEIYGNNPGGNPGSPADDFVNGDGTGIIGDGVTATDQDNADPALIRVVDLALRKTISVTTPGPFKYGDIVKFDLHAINQGGTWMDSVEITDYIATGFIFDGALNPGWMLNGPTKAVYTIKGRLAPGDDSLVCIRLKVKPITNLAEADTAWLNLAEISQAYDTTGRDVSMEDIDGPLNDNPGDNAGGQPNSPADDAVDGDGTGMIGDGVDSTDSDSHDPALVRIIDLALRKVIADTLTPPLSYGDTIKYAIQLFNQGNVPIDSLDVTDYLPSGLEFVTPNGLINAGWDGTDPMNPVYHWGGATLFAGQSDTICLWARVKMVTASEEVTPDYTNFAEISFAQDTAATDVSMDDADSPLNNNPADNGGGQPDSQADDEINGNGTGVIGDGVANTDQDNHDPANLNIVDLALRKTISATTPPPFRYKDTVKFDIYVVNQGETWIDSFAVTDYIAPGFTFSAAINPGWTLTGTKATAGFKQRLASGKDTTVCLRLIIKPLLNNSHLDSAWLNLAEISFASDTTGKDVSMEDIDGPLNDNPFDNAGGQPETSADDHLDGDGSGTPGDGVDSTDSDSHDPALVMIMDLAHRKVLDPSSMAPYLINDTIKFQLQVFNQGNVPIETLTLTDSIPIGYRWDASINPGWTGAYPKVSYVLTPPTPLMPGQSDTVCIYLVIDISPSNQGTPSDFFVNRSEISFIQDTAGNNTGNGSTEDADSKPDTNLGNDGGGQVSTPSDDAIGGDGTGAPGGNDPNSDEDDEDIATLEIIDIAMLKQIDSLGTTFPLRYGASVKFKIILENQGTVMLQNIKVVDYIPSGLEFDAANSGNAGWVLNGDKAKITVPGQLLPWQQDTICIYLKLKMQFPSNDSAWTNRAEVYEVSDPRGLPRTDDVDSPLNDNPYDNAGGMIESDADDYLSGDGSGMIGDGVNSTDQDNADPVKVKIYDLALKKTTSELVVKEGDIVPFKVVVYNQGNEPLQTIKITDYIPSDFSFSSGTGWTPVGLSTACYTLTGPLNPGDSMLLPVLNLLVANPAINLPEGLYNYAEVSSAKDTSGVVPPDGDIDSQWDSDPTNDSGGDLFNSDDNNLTGDHYKGEDEDDHDGAFVIVCKGFVCQDNVNVSLDESCSKVVTAADVLAHSELPSIFYDEVVIKDASGKIVPMATFNRSNLGYCYTYSVSASVCGKNSCWGTICVEDKFPPAIDCTPDTILCFELEQIPTEITVNDNCAGPTKVVIAGEQFIDYGCDSPNIQGVVKRKLIASDIWGNTAQCEKLYYIRKISIGDVVCPRDTSVDCSIAEVELTIKGNKKLVSIKDPIRSGAPMVMTSKGLIPLWPNNPSCKLSVDYSDKTLSTCGGGYKFIRTWTISDWCAHRDTICRQTIAVEDKTAPIARDTILATKAADPHDCRALFYLEKLPVTDCSEVTQSYRYPYLDEATGATRIANGSLPASIWVGNGRTEITVTLTDACNNITTRKITVNVIDNTPPTPVCIEYTQVTVDPASCWAAVAARDLNTGSHDNCISQLHYAAALMSDIEKARADYEKRIIDSCGKAAYWANKAWYDAYIEQWINCYVFKDTIQFNDCGNNQVVMRVYEADSMPRLDPHIWTCGEHAWFCYNTYQDYRIVYNQNFYGNSAKKDCQVKGPWLCKESSIGWYANLQSTYGGARVLGSNGYYAGSTFPQTHLYNDCMVQVLVDDKQAPVVAGLQDITVYCDGAPGGSAYARTFCSESERFSTWPGAIKDGNGTQHGYYGGSTYIVNHTPGNDHADPTGCPTDQWSPIYCKKWLLLDSFDQAGQINPKDYFDVLVKFDKNRPSRALKGNEFSITDNCKLDDASLKVTDAGSLNGCGEGWIQRTWTMTDKCGNPVTAIQKIIVKHRSDFEVIFPADIEVSCEASDAVDTSHTGIPVISDDDCEQVGVRYEDEISTVTDGACYKIVRTWTLIDWCIYDPNAHTIHPDVIVDDRLRANQTDRACIMRNIKDNGDGYVKYVQIIKVTDHQAPVVTCKDSTLCITNGCTANINIPLNGTDNCAEKVLFRVDITRPDNSTETRVDVSAITGSFTAGIYKVRIIGRDHCGNEDTCQMNLTIKDCKAPTPYCLNGVATVVMPSTGSIQIWAKDLDRASEDNCTPKDKLKFSFSKNTADVSRVLSCSDILNGREQAIELSIWVTDEAGNADFCRTYILLQDNGGTPGGVCKDTTVAFANVTGRLYTEDQEGVEFATVEVKGQSSAGIPSFKTASDGSYLFSSLPMSGIQSIKALRDDNPMNGVSTLDLILIQKHILGTEKLKSAYKMIAADVDNNNDISVIDLIELRKLILGLYDKLPNNTSWKFVPKSHTFTDIENPWGYPTEEVIHNMKEQMTSDFVGVKIGDVNSSALSHSLMGTEIRGNETGLIFEVQDKLYRKGERVEVQFTSPNFKGVSGFQGTMSIGEKQLRMENIDAGSIKVNESNIGRRWATEGLITMSWNGAQSVDLTDQEVLFTMVFTAQADGRLSEVLRIGSQRTKAESYEGKGELGNVSIRFIGQNGQEVTGRSTLYQNYPNPFDQRTVIGLNLADSGRGTLKITDITGRTIKVIEKDWSKGYQEVWMDRRDIQATGVLYYSFESNSFKAVRKMVLLE